MFDHVHLRVRDLGESRRFHETVLAPLGLEVTTDTDDLVELHPDGHNVEAVHRSAETRASWSWIRWEE